MNAARACLVSHLHACNGRPEDWAGPQAIEHQHLRKRQHGRDPDEPSPSTSYSSGDSASSSGADMNVDEVSHPPGAPQQPTGLMHRACTHCCDSRVANATTAAQIKYDSKQGRKFQVPCSCCHLSPVVKQCIFPLNMRTAAIVVNLSRRSIAATMRTISNVKASFTALHRTGRIWIGT